MKTIEGTQHMHPVVYAIRTLINKFLQNPEVYPIKYYKKGKRFRKHWKTEPVK